MWRLVVEASLPRSEPRDQSPPETVMANGLSPVQRIGVVTFAAIGGAVLAAAGLVLGANFGGNYCNTCEFNDLRGYEAMGQLGAVLGAILGFALGAGLAWALFHKRNAKRAAQMASSSH